MTRYNSIFSRPSHKIKNTEIENRIPFSAITLLVGQQDEQLAPNKPAPNISKGEPYFGKRELLHLNNANKKTAVKTVKAKSNIRLCEFTTDDISST